MKKITKKMVGLCAALLLAHGALAQTGSLNCTFNGLADGTRILVSEARGGRLVPTDTLTPDSKGRVKLDRPTADPLLLTMGLLQENGPAMHVMLMPRESIKLTVDYMPAINFLNITSTKGSENMRLYKEYTNLASDLLLRQRLDLMGEQLSALLDSNASQLMSAFLVTYFEQQFEQYVPLYKKIRDALIGQWSENEFVRHLDNRLKTVLIAGMEAPDIALPDRTGKTRRLSDLRGKVVLIDFWASWCRPCRMENPNVVRLYKQYHSKGFEVFSVSLDNKREAWLNAIEADGLEWENHVSDLRGWSSAGGRLYGVQSIPSTVLVDKDGKILARNLRGQDLERKLKEILGE